MVYGTVVKGMLQESNVTIMNIRVFINFSIGLPVCVIFVFRRLLNNMNFEYTLFL